MSTELVRNDPMPMAAREEPQDLLRMAVERGADVGTIERLMVVRKELRAEAAKTAFDAALAAFQSECPIIEKRRLGAKGAYRYAPLDHIVEQVRPLILKHGFSFSVTSEIEAGWVLAKCKITHMAGHSEVSEFKVPIDNKNPMMSDPQRYAGSLTFSKRYAFCNGFGILTADEDKDGDLTKVKPPGPASATPKTRAWMLAQLKDIKSQAHSYAIDHGWVMPDAAIDTWDLAHVTVTKQELAELRKEIEAMP